MLNILIADDHEMVRRGLKDLLYNEYTKLYIGEAKDHEEIMVRLAERKWDLILLDIVMPEFNVIDVLAQIRERDAEVPVLILTAVSETEYAVRTLKAGANGYISKQYTSDELICAVRKVMSGGIYLSSEAVDALAVGLRNDKPVAPHEALSRRELEVFCLIAKGRTVKEIAFELSLSAKTVSTYVSRIREKTNIENYVDIARYAIHHKLVD